jgi:hypothetical protein
MSGTARVSVATGHDVAGTALVAMTPQPHYGGMEFAQEIDTPAGPVRNCPYARLRMPALKDTEYTTSLTQVGLGSAGVERADITIALPNDEDRDTTTRYNARITKPRSARWQVPLQRGIEYVVVLLEEL